MTTPKLRDEAPGILSIRAVQYATDDSDYDIEAEQAFLDGAFWTLSNLHLLLEPINWGETHADAHKIVDSIIDKRVAIVEVEGE